MSFELTNNKVYLFGTVETKPVFSHEIFGESFYDINLKVSRLSEQVDVIPITISERLFSQNNLSVGSQIALKGQFRSYNKVVDGKSKLMLTVFVRELCDKQPNISSNIIEITGSATMRIFTINNNRNVFS